MLINFAKLWRCSLKYIPGDFLEEARLAIRAGVPIGDVSRRLGIEPEQLRSALGLPEATRPKPIRGDRESGVDLWRIDDLDRVL